MASDLQRFSIHKKAQEACPWVNYDNDAKWKTACREWEHIKVNEKGTALFGTFSSSAHLRLDSGVALLLGDECGQASEPETLQFLKHVSSQTCTVLIGDPDQLPPVVKCENASFAGLGTSLLERLMHIPRLVSVMLDIQYRMAPVIARWPSQYYYRNLVSDGPQHRPPVKGFPSLYHSAPGPASGHIVFVNVYNSEESSVQGNIQNIPEAQVAQAILEELLRCNRDINHNDVCVITPYVGQRTYLRRHVNRNVPVDTVDGFQGRECEIVILSTVRCGNTIGFLDDYRRLNVSLTRAKRGIIVLGSVATLYQGDQYAGWASFLTYVWNQQALLTCHWDCWERLRYKACDLPRSRLQDWELPEVRPKKPDKKTLELASTALISYTPMSMDEQRRILTEAQNALQMLATNRCFILSLGFVMDLSCGWSGGSSV